MIKLLKYIKYVILFRFFSIFRVFTRNAKNIQKLRNSKAGKRCFVIATGPSLVPDDLDLLKNEDTFGVNSIFLMYNQTTWRPKYYICTDAPYFSKLIQSYGITPDELCIEELFLNSDTRKIDPSFESSHIRWIPFSPWNRIYDFEKYQIMTNISRGMFAFGTVTNIAITIAMYMGYSEIYLLGADCNNLNQHFINDITDKDKDEEYVKNITRTQLRGYEIMKSETSKKNVTVYNSTRGGKLEIFPRVSLDTLIKEEIE